MNLCLDRLMNINDGRPLHAITANLSLEGKTTTHYAACLFQICLITATQQNL